LFATRASGVPLSPILTGLTYVTLLFLVGGVTAQDLNKLRSLLMVRRIASRSAA
jgi:hypothetical protein